MGWTATRRGLAFAAAGVVIAAACGNNDTAQTDPVRNMKITVPVGVTVAPTTVAAALANMVSLTWLRAPGAGQANQSRTSCRPLISCAPFDVDYTVRPSTNQQQGQDFVAVAFGDSFASGEGAPYGNFSGPQPSNRNDVRFNANDPSWPRGGGNSYDQWFGPQRCHRSSYAPFTQIMARLAVAYPEVSMAFRNFACSGATSRHLYESQTMDFLSYRGDSNSYAPQAAVAKSWLGGRPADAVYMNMGGNDAGFSRVITICADPIWDCDWGSERRQIQNIAACIAPRIDRVFNTAQVVLSGGTPYLEAEDPTSIVDLLVSAATNPTELAAAIQRWAACDDRPVLSRPGTPWVRPGAPKLYSVPPFLAQYRNKSGRIMDCGDNEDDYGRMEGFPDSLLDRNDIATIRTEFANPLFNNMRTIAARAGWRVIDQPDWRAHGLCAQVPYVHNIGSAIATQGSDMEAGPGLDLSSGHFHPNHAGYVNWADHMYPHMERMMLEVVTPRGEVTTTVRPDGSLEMAVQTRDPIGRTTQSNERAFADGRTNVSLKVEAQCRRGSTTTVKSGTTSFAFFGIQGVTYPVMASPCGTDTNLGVKITGRICLRNSTRVCSALSGPQAGVWVRPAVVATTTTTTTVRLPTITNPGITLPGQK
jgi:hypothetical protein